MQAAMKRDIISAPCLTCFLDCILTRDRDTSEIRIWQTSQCRFERAWRCLTSNISLPLLLLCDLLGRLTQHLSRCCRRLGLDTYQEIIGSSCLALRSEESGILQHGFVVG